MTYEEFSSAIKDVLVADTSAHPEEWSVKDPFLGHCTVVSLLAQEIFGGEIVRVDLERVAGLEHIRRHSWNKLSNGQEIDFTSSQLPQPIPASVPRELKDRNILLSYPGVKERYSKLKVRFQERLNLLKNLQN